MRIKRLEIFGFKSFADRVLIHFDAGVTGIVGPNGCGKSNIVDALRWVMGEQNAKHLRGDQMQDIIFNGSQNRGPMGLAEVNLTLENDGELVPSEYKHFDEIEVTRRLYRNGDSEYEINKRSCRLRDITEFFLGTGVGTKAYSIIEQGRVSNLVQAKPEDRRQIIEEAAGITKYKMRKAAAERKMESTQQNLLRIQDITQEVEQRLNSLEKQAQKAERYERLRAQIRELELHEASIRFFEHSNQIRFLTNEHSTHHMCLNKQTQAIATHEEKIQTERSKLQDHEQKLSLTQNMIHVVENTIALAQQDIQFTQSTLSSKQKQAVHTQDESKRLANRLAELNQERERLKSQCEELGIDNSKLQAQVTKASQALQTLTQQRVDQHQAQHQLQSKIMQTAREATEAQGEITSTQRATEQAKVRDKALEQEWLLLQTQLSTQAAQRDALISDITTTQNYHQTLQSQVTTLSTQLTELNAQLESSFTRQSELAHNQASKQARLIALQENLYDLDKSCIARKCATSTGLLAKNHELQSLDAELAAFSIEAKALEQTLAELEPKQAELQSQLDMAKTEAQTQALSLARLEEALKSKELQEKNLRTRLNAIESERAKLLLDAADDLKILQDKWALALEVHQKLESDLKTLQTEAAEFEIRYAAESEAVTRLRIDAGSSQERINHLTRLEQQTLQNIEDIRLQTQNLDRQLKELSEDEIALHTQSQLAQEKIASASKELVTLQKNKALEQETCQAQKHALQALESAISEQRLEIDTLQKTCNRLQINLRESELAIEALNTRLKEKYRLKPIEILHDYHHKPFDPDLFEQNLKECKRQIEHLGPINQSAIEEFAELQKRFAFLSTQSLDLSKALDQLEAAIQKINETTIQRFQDAFNAINHKFSQVFPRLFRGGKAWLELTNSEDLLNTGVEIFAQPPGKKLASIALMSGGEKALTATSLIFSIFLIKPSPFCLLDEVDAPLDEANVDRFGLIVQEMSKISQFIVITHNKRTMEKADQLYGVTMEQAGISKTVQVKVKESTHAVGPGSELAFVQ